MAIDSSDTWTLRSRYLSGSASACGRGLNRLGALPCRRGELSMRTRRRFVESSGRRPAWPAPPWPGARGGLHDSRPPRAGRRRARAAAAPAPAGAGGADGGAGGAYPRNETLYTSGTQWGPPNSWNPVVPSHAMGTGPGLRNAVPLRRGEATADPVAGREGGVDRHKTYTLTLREGIKWGDGKPFVADDVASPSSWARSRPCPTATCGTGWAAEAVDAANGQVHVHRPATRNGTTGSMRTRSCPSTSGPPAPRTTSPPRPTRSRSAPARTST